MAKKKALKRLKRLKPRLYTKRDKGFVASVMEARAMRARIRKALDNAAKAAAKTAMEPERVTLKSKRELVNENKALRIMLKNREAVVENLREEVAVAERKADTAEVALGQFGGPFVWTTKEGDEVTPEQMDDVHLQNAVHFVLRRLVASAGSARYVRPLADHARAFVEFVHEAERRGIEV